MPKFEGTGVALVTPFNADKSIDYDKLEQLIDYVIDNGIDFLVSMGTTGESATLSKAEKKEVLTFTAEQAGDRVPVVAGIGGNNTRDLINFMDDFHFEGIDGILSVSPYYNKPSQQGLYEHYKALADAAPRPIILYNVPGRTGKNIEAATTLRLANDCDNIVAIKEASGDLEQIMEIINNKPGDFTVLSGDDPLTMPLISCGGSGVISVTANAFPHTFTTMVDEARQYNFDKAQTFHYKLYDIIQLHFADGNPPGVKASLHILGKANNEFRLPVVPVSDETYQALETEIDKLQ